MPKRFRDAKKQRQLNEDALAKDILEECRVQLMLKFRFLDLALWKMELEPVRAGAMYPLATDGKRVYFDPPREISRFNESFEECVRDYLHLIMHCIFRHPFDKNHDDAVAWNLACDVLVESAVIDICGARFASADDAQRKSELSEIALYAGKTTPSKVYQLIKAVNDCPDGQTFRGISRSKIALWRDIFERDDHGAWPANNKNQYSEDGVGEEFDARRDDENPDFEMDTTRLESASEDSESAGGGKNESAFDVDSSDEGSQEQLTEDASAQDLQDLQDEPSQGQDFGETSQEKTEEEKAWEEIASELEMNLQTFSKEWGKEAGSLMMQLSFANKKTTDYANFLRRFMVVSENMQVNQDEFDYVYYTFGMDTYGNMPLIEPLEYKESQRVRDFVIAIDTSESVRGDLVKKFVRYTFEIVKSSEDFDAKVNIHVIQCDTKVQSDMVICDIRDVDKLMDGFVVRGFGGTDFRPAFDYVDVLRKRGQLTDLKGMIYFTDGLGQFPERPPDFDAAFVFVEDESASPVPVPPWAMRVVIDEAMVERL